MREQLQTMERLFATQISAVGGVTSAAPAAVPAAMSPAVPAVVSSEPAVEILMPDTGADAPSRFRVYKPAPETGAFLELEHPGTAFLSRIKLPRPNGQ